MFKLCRRNTMVTDMFKWSIFLLAVEVIWMADCVCDNCDRCLQDKCINKNNNECKCELECKPGYYGQRCVQDCPEQCLTCGRDYGLVGDPTYGICYECAAGFHNGSSMNCLCPIKCEKCTSTTSCTACIDGWYGAKCQSKCPTNCNACSSSSSCSSCKKGWYSTTCQSSCSQYCVNNVCQKGDGYCTQGCTTGTWGNRCLHICPASCKGDVCSQSDGSCTDGCKDNFAQTNDGKCSDCVPGKYGNNCQHQCPSETCTNNVCDRDDGKCKTCKDNFVSGSKGLCEICVAGRYGGNCDMYCRSTRCLNNQCNRDDGTCSNGCDRQTITGQYCDRCINGNYGNECSLDCPSNCNNLICNRNSGVCTNGCKNDLFKGDKCEQCKDGYYGEQCSVSCPVNCQGKVCDKNSGKCSKGCFGQFVGDKCEECMNGVYGPNCDTQCPSLKCINNKCDRGTGLCTNGCQGSYTGDLCCINNGQCKTCTNAATCSECQGGFHGATCAEQCPRYCDGGCMKSNGDCLLCKNGFYGTKCENTCSNRCVANVCDFKSGRCLQGCESGYFKDQCSESCSVNCLTDYCAQDTGRCTGCVDGFHGATCTKACSSLCINSTCTQDRGVCIHGCSSGSNGSCVALPSTGPMNLAGPVAGGISGVIVLLLVVAVAILVFRRRRRNDAESCDTLNKLPIIGKKSKSPPTVAMNAEATYQNEGSSQRAANGSISNELETDEDLSADDVVVDINEPEYSNVGEANTDINVSDLYKYITNTEKQVIVTEFKQIPRSFPHPHTDAQKPQNKSLNRFKGIYPYDHSRVKLKEDPNFFINACYIDGYDKKKSYIASVGPTTDITDRFISFWKMVWAEKADIIVMLTNLNEASGMKCEQYWPDSDQTVVYGDISVTNDGTDVYAEYNLTRLTMSKGKQQRKITHLQYTAWPDKSVPDNVVSLVEFRQRAKSMTSRYGGPMIVHCSAGVGRTGTFIAMDILTEQGKSEQIVNVFKCVLHLREQRVIMVQTHEQYDYLFRCLVYTVVFDSDPLTNDLISTYVASLDDQAYTRRFKMLEYTVEGDSAEEKEAKEINGQLKDKNRPGADIPGSKNRIRLFLGRSFEDSDYINAVYINSFKENSKYIVAQTPLKETLNDFLCMVYQTKCTCVVDMYDAVPSQTKNVGVYLPSDGGTIKAGSYTVACTRRETKSSFIKSMITVKNSSKQMQDEVKVEHYQYTGWGAESEAPDNVSDFVQFVNHIRTTADVQSHDLRPPTIIHCLNAYERSGLVCTLAILLEKMEVEQQVSIDNTIRQVRLRRKKAIPNKAQYKVVHECLQAYLEMFSEYSNFPAR